MKILLFVPDNNVTDNFVPQLWPFVLQRLTPPEHQAVILDGNGARYDEDQLIAYILENKFDLVGMGFMTRMAQAAYRMAAAIRKGTGVPIVMGGPHVSAKPDEALGRENGPPFADSVVVGEAEDLWSAVLADAVAGRLQPVYRAAVADGRSVKPSLRDYPILAWDRMDLQRFDLMRHVPNPLQKLLRRLQVPFRHVYVIPVESGRGCAYGCEFCSVTGYFGEQIRFRETNNVIAELQRLKELGRRENALVITFFVDDNLAINRPRAKALLRQMIAEDACLPWVGQVSINLLADEELVELMARSGCRWIFIGLESTEPNSLKVAGKSFNKPEEYGKTLALLAKHNIYAITSFIFGMDGDQAGISRKTTAKIDDWPSVLPVFGLLTPFPGTPLYDRLNAEGRLFRPRHWLDFAAFKATFVHRHLTPDQLEKEVRGSWRHCYAPAAFRRSQRWLKKNRKPFGVQLMHFAARLIFRGIYFRQKTRRTWFFLLLANMFTIFSLIRSGFQAKLAGSRRPVSRGAGQPFPAAQALPPEKTTLSGEGSGDAAPSPLNEPAVG